MCGIAGVFYADHRQIVDRDVLHAMADSLAHRGPDAEGIWVEQGIGLAHRRLSIIDLEGGDQPIGNEDDSIQVVFNGELYNFQTLRGELESRGHRFRTRTDTEVLVHLYEEYGERLVEKLRGMFAFAIYDRPRRRVLLARDRIGLKPLYYSRDSKKLVFGSEIKAILQHPGIGRQIDPEALEDYLAFGFIPGERTIFESIRKLAPGHTLSIGPETHAASPKRYWQLNVELDDDLSLDEWSDRLGAKLKETVEAHRIADVPVGAFLSGGLDSSVIVAEASELACEPIQTFSIGFQEKKFSELPYARQLADRYQTRHTEEIVTPEAAKSLDDLVYYYDEPFADSSAIPTMHVSRLARERVKVVLSGDGGDEAFGGYTRYVHDLREWHIRRRIPRAVRRFVLKQLSQVWPKTDWLPRPLRAKTTLTNLSLEPAAAYANSVSLCRLPLRRQLLSNDVISRLDGYRPETAVENAFLSGGTDPLACMTTADIGTLLPDDFLTKVDRASMAVGLEVRPPLVDHELLELAARIPSRWKIRRGETKWILKSLAADRLPADVIWRPKQGFEIPVDAWLRGPLRERFKEDVLSTSSRLSEYINVKTVSPLYRAHLRRTGRHGAVLWSLLVLGRWMREYLPPAPAAG